LVVKLYGSFNSRFFGVLTPSEVRLYRGIAAGGDFGVASNEAQLVFARAMDESLGLELIRVGNQGDLFFLGKKGLFRLKNDRNARLEVVNDALCALARGEDIGRLGQVRVDADGREIFYEAISPEAGIKDRFRKLWGGKGGGESTLAHQVINFNLGTQRKDQFPPTLIDTRREYAFRWNISPSGRFLVQARPEKKSYHLDVIDISDESIIADFQMALANIHDLWVNDAGVIMVDVRQIGEEKVIIALPDGVTRHPFSPPPSYRLVHLGPLHVGMILESQRRLQIYDYVGNLVSDVDFQPLRQMNAQFHFNFNDRGQIDILLWHNGSLHLQHSDIKSILVDAKRWNLTARQAQADIEQQMVHEITVQHMEDRKRMEDFQLSRQLLDAVQSEIPGMGNQAHLPRLGGERGPSAPPTPLPPPIASIPSVPQIPDATSGLTEVPPWMAGLTGGGGGAPPPPPAPLPTPQTPIPPPAPPERVPVPPPPPPAPIDRNAPPPMLPSRPSSSQPPQPPQPQPPQLPFLRGSSPLPPPDTETSGRVSANLPAPAPDSAPLPAPASAPLAHFSSSAEVDAELERLRMTYIAGEISREVYYSRRAELEGLRRSLAGSTPSGPAGPKRLDLDLDLGGPPAGGQAPPPVLRRRPAESSLELPLPGVDDDF
jgi:hypothetical protein